MVRQIHGTVWLVSSNLLVILRGANHPENVHQFLERTGKSITQLFVATCETGAALPCHTEAPLPTTAQEHCGCVHIDVDCTLASIILRTRVFHLWATPVQSCASVAISHMQPKVRFCNEMQHHHMQPNAIVCDRVQPRPLLVWHHA